MPQPLPVCWQCCWLWSPREHALLTDSITFYLSYYTIYLRGSLNEHANLQRVVSEWSLSPMLFFFLLLLLLVSLR